MCLSRSGTYEEEWGTAEGPRASIRVRLSEARLCFSSHLQLGGGWETDSICMTNRSGCSAGKLVQYAGI